MDRLEAMSVFVTVADLRGFAPAARKLGLSTSAVTRAIAALEEQLGTLLLQRTTRSVSLTDTGARYLERARRILAEVGEAEADARDDPRLPKGRLVVTAPSAFGRLHVASLMSEYLARYPSMRGELLLTDELLSLVEERVDVAIRIGNLDDSSAIGRVVGATRRVVVASPSYLAKRGTPQKPADLEDHSLIQFTALTSLSEWRFEQKQDEERVRIDPRYVTNSVDAALDHAEAGGGLAMVFSYQASDRIRSGKLVVVLADHEPTPRPIQIVFPTARMLPAKVRAFIDLATAKQNWHFLKL